jgi:hypothetical protein
MTLMRKVLPLLFVFMALMFVRQLTYAGNNDVSETLGFAQAPFLETLAKQIQEQSATSETQYKIGKVSFSPVKNSSDTASSRYYTGSDGVSSLMVRNAGKDFSALLNYQGSSYTLTATTLTVLSDEFDQAAFTESDAVEGHAEATPYTDVQGRKSSFYESYNMSNKRSSQSTQSTQAFYEGFDTSALKRVRVLVSENAIIEELEKEGEFNFATLHQRIQSGIDYANLALITSGVEALQIEASEVVVQRLPKNYAGSVIEEDTFKRIAFPTWGEDDATFQMTALALTQDHADIIYNLGARELFRTSTCGFANIGVNGKKSDTTTYSSDHTYPIAITVKRGCETGRTPVHEFGHTIGLNHERDNNGSQLESGVSVPYSHNYGFTSLEESAYSIMSYGLACAENSPHLVCTRANYFSSPNVKYGNTAFGIPTPDPDAADAVRFLNDAWALRFKNTINPMTISPEASGGFTIRWTNTNNAQSQVLVLSSSSHSRYNYVLDNNAVNSHRNLEIPLLANQNSYTFTAEQMRDLDVENKQFDTASVFTGHVNKYGDIVPNLHAQLHAGQSLKALVDDLNNAAILIDDENVKAPKAGETITFSFDVSRISNFDINDLTLMTILDSQYNARFTTAVNKREYDMNEPMLDSINYSVQQTDSNTVELSLRFSSDYRDYVGFLTNRESSNYKLPIIGFYFDYVSNRNGVYQQTVSQEVGVDLRAALKAIPYIQAESFARVIDNDRTSPVVVTFTSSQEIAPSDVSAVIEGASAYEIGDVITTWEQLPSKNNKYQYAVTVENPEAIDDEGDNYASVSFGLKSLNLFSTSMVIASNKLMFDDNNSSLVKVSQQVETSLSFNISNLPANNYEASISVSTQDTIDVNVPVAGTLTRVNEQQGTLNFMFDPHALHAPTKLRINISVEEGGNTQTSHHWVDVQYNSAPQIIPAQTRFTAKAGETLTIPFPQVDDADDFSYEAEVTWEKQSDATTVSTSNSSFQVTINSDALANTSHVYTFEVSDGIDTASIEFTVDIAEGFASSSVNTSQTTTTTAPNQASPASSDESGGGALGIISVCFLLVSAWFRRIKRFTPKPA